MNRPLRTVLGLLAVLLFASPAGAQLFRAYLSSTGSDANPCTLAAPCRLLPAALATVASGGEIWMLDSANFNAGVVEITKSVTILAIPGEMGSVVAQAGSPAIGIVTAGIDVTLRNLVIVNSATDPGTNGITMVDGDSLTVEDCLIANMPGNGIEVGTAAKVTVSNSVIRNAQHGIAAGSGASVGVSNVIISSMIGSGVIGFGFAPTPTRIAISDSHITNTQIGVYAHSFVNPATVRIVVARSSMTLGTFGVVSQIDAPGGVASVTVGDSLIAGNTGSAFVQFNAGAVTESFGNNTVRSNGGNVSGTLTPVPSM